MPPRAVRSRSSGRVEGHRGDGRPGDRARLLEVFGVGFVLHDQGVTQRRLGLRVAWVERNGAARVARGAGRLLVRLARTGVRDGAVAGAFLARQLGRKLLDFRTARLAGLEAAHVPARGRKVAAGERLLNRDDVARDGGRERFLYPCRRWLFGRCDRRGRNRLVLDGGALGAGGGACAAIVGAALSLSLTVAL